MRQFPVERFHEATLFVLFFPTVEKAISIPRSEIPVGDPSLGIIMTGVYSATTGLRRGERCMPVISQFPSDSGIQLGIRSALSALQFL
jgi:hypothetical protein